MGSISAKFDKFVFIVALFCGSSKPSSLKGYLQNFKIEVVNLLQNEINFNEK